MEIHEGGSSGQQRQKCPKQRRASKEISYENNMMNLTRYGRATLRLVTPQNKRPLTTIPENSVVVFDNTCLDYDLLRSGCITDERLKPNNRLYKVLFLISFNIM